MLGGHGKQGGRKPKIRGPKALLKGRLEAGSPWKKKGRRAQKLQLTRPRPLLRPPLSPPLLTPLPLLLLLLPRARLP